MRFARYWFPRRFWSERDLILLDQRASGLSEPTLCPELDAAQIRIFAADLDPEQELDAREEAAASCLRSLQRAGVDLAAYNRRASAADVEDLRAALGVERWNLYATSNGTKLALTVLQQGAGGVRSAVLDSPYPPVPSSWNDKGADLAGALEVLFRDCAADPRCAAAFPDLRGELVSAIDSYADTPMRVDLAPRSGLPAGAFVVNAQDWILFLQQALYRRELLPLLPLLVRAASQRDPGFVRGAADAMEERLRWSGYAAYLLTECFDRRAADAVRPAPRGDPLLARLERSFTLFELERRLCARFPGAAASPREIGPVASRVPALVLAGAYDPVTPPAFAARTAATLEGSRMLVFPGLGHTTVFSHPCPARIAEQFWRDPLGPLDTSCRDGMGAPRFEVELWPTPGAYRFVREVAIERSLAPLALSLGVPLVLASAAIGWPVSALLGRRRGRRRDGLRGARIAAGVAAAAGLALVLGLAAAIGITARQSPGLLAFGLPRSARPLLLLAPLVAGGAALAAIGLVRTSDRAGALRRAHCAAVVAACALVLAALVRYELW